MGGQLPTSGGSLSGLRGCDGKLERAALGELCGAAARVGMAPLSFMGGSANPPTIVGLETLWRG
jgi:hypothetical protein